MIDILKKNVGAEIFQWRMLIFPGGHEYALTCANTRQTSRVQLVSALRPPVRRAVYDNRFRAVSKLVRYGCAHSASRNSCGMAVRPAARSSTALSYKPR